MNTEGRDHDGHEMVLGTELNKLAIRAVQAQDERNRILGSISVGVGSITVILFAIMCVLAALFGRSCAL